MENPSQTARRLLKAWLLLVALTVASLGAVLGFGATEAGFFAAAIALAAAYWKARLVLDHFLDLRHADAQWRGFFSGLLMVILGGLLAAYAWVEFGA